MRNTNQLKKTKHIVFIGGGTGVPLVLSALKNYNVHLSAIVTMADDGGSTGILRDEFGILPTGDVRRALVALSPQSREFLVKLFMYRFTEGGINGHNFGNLILTALERITGSFDKAIQKASELLDITAGDVIPVTLSNVRLFAELEDGTVVKGETNIDIPKHDGSLRIMRVWLEPKARPNPRAVDAIQNADLIVVGPGDLYTSILPNLLVNSIANAIKTSRAKKVYVLNLMTKFGETHGFAAQDFVDVLEKYLGKDIFHTIIVNNKRPHAALLRKYKKERAFLVDCYFGKDFSMKNKNRVICADLLRQGPFIRHDPEKLARVLMGL